MIHLIMMTSPAPQKQKNRLPIIALILAFAPAFWLVWYLPGFLFVIFGIFITLFLISYFGLLLQIIGLILGIIAIIIMVWRKDIKIKGLIFSIIAIIAPFVWGYFLFFTSVLDYTLSYK